MLYTAIHHLSLEGEHLYPGEVFEAELAEGQEARLLKLGAVQRLPQAVEASRGAEVPEMEAPEVEDSGETGAESTEEEAPEEPPMVLDAAAGVTAKKRTRKEKA